MEDTCQARLENWLKNTLFHDKNRMMIEKKSISIYLYYSQPHKKGPY
jgi:hypothetical protein